MAKFYDLKFSQLKNQLENRGLATKGVKFELQSRLREAMEAENINVDEYVFQLELEEEGYEDRRGAMLVKGYAHEHDFCCNIDADIIINYGAVGCTIVSNVRSAWEAFVARFPTIRACMLAQLVAHEAHIPTQEEPSGEQEAYIPAQTSSQSKEKEDCIPEQVFSQLEEQEACIPVQEFSHSKDHNKTKAEVHEDPDLKSGLH